ncbi:MAG: hypothetical protein ACYTFT_05995 [Planctomycetota bacterium]|jgi:hypothetical protein
MPSATRFLGGLLLALAAVSCASAPSPTGLTPAIVVPRVTASARISAWVSVRLDATWSDRDRDQALGALRSLDNIASATFDHEKAEFTLALAGHLDLHQIPRILRQARLEPGRMVFAASGSLCMPEVAKEHLAVHPGCRSRPVSEGARFRPTGWERGVAVTWWLDDGGHLGLLAEVNCSQRVPILVPFEWET